MKITPLEIRQKQFEKALRGYDKDEVSAFLLSLSQEWERAQDEVKEMRIKLDATEREVTKLREVESSLYKTLKTAEDTGSNMIDQANKTAELHMRETQLKAEAMLNEAKTKAKDVIETADNTSKQILEEMEDRLKALVQNYKTLESQKDNLLSDLKRLAGETIDRVERAKNNSSEFNADQHLTLAKREAKRILSPNANFEMPPKKTVMPESTHVEERLAVFADQKRAPKSFFDDIQ
jgi:cell division initiation protein